MASDVYFGQGGTYGLGFGSNYVEPGFVAWTLDLTSSLCYHWTP